MGDSEEFGSKEQAHGSGNSSVSDSSDEIENEQANNSEISSDTDSSDEIENEQALNSEESSDSDSSVEIENEQARNSKNSSDSDSSVEIENEQARNSESSSDSDSSVEIEDEQAHISQNSASSVQIAERYKSRDIWSTIATFFDKESLVTLMCAWRWFKEVVMGLDTDVWKQTVLHQLKMPDPGHIEFNWKEYYIGQSFRNAMDGTDLFTHFSDTYDIFDMDKLIERNRMGALYLTSNKVHVSARNVTQEHMTLDIEGVLPGIWIAEAYLADCPHCDEYSCNEFWTFLSLRHSDLFIMEDLLELEELKREKLTGLKAREAILVGGQSVGAAESFKGNSRGDEGFFFDLKYELTSHGVACHINNDVEEDKTYDGVYSVMRNNEGRVVLILVQHLLSHVYIVTDMQEFEDLEDED